MVFFFKKAAYLCRYDQLRLSGNRSGFTLIEILVAIAIFGVVISIVFSSFREVAVSSGVVNDNISAWEMGKNALDRISGDLKSVHVSIPPVFVKPGFDSEPDSCRFTGIIDASGSVRAPQLRFTSTAHLPLGENMREGIAAIVYYLDALEDGEAVLRRYDSLDLDVEFEKRDDPVVCRRVEEFAVTYYNSEGDEFEEWNSESDIYDYATPVAVKVSLTTGMEKGGNHTFETRVALPMVRKAID